MKFRHELKTEINHADYLALRSRLRAIMSIDSHAADGKYFVRSLYFDNASDRALREKIEGFNRREKFRIRYYNFNTDFLCLEKKSKLNGLCNKQSVRITEQQASSILKGDIVWLKDSTISLFSELHYKIKSEGLAPKTVVDYVREPFVYGPGNVRVTFDYDIRTGLRGTDFLNKDFVTVPAGNAPIIMEVKFDAFLPDIIRDAIQLVGRGTSAFSKYAQCRIYG